MSLSSDCRVIISKYMGVILKRLGGIVLDCVVVFDGVDGVWCVTLHFDKIDAGIIGANNLGVEIVKPLSVLHCALIRIAALESFREEIVPGGVQIYLDCAALSLAFVVEEIIVSSLLSENPIRSSFAGVFVICAT